MSADQPTIQQKQAALLQQSKELLRNYHTMLTQLDSPNSRQVLNTIRAIENLEKEQEAAPKAAASAQSSAEFKVSMPDFLEEAAQLVEKAQPFVRSLADLFGKTK